MSTSVSGNRSGTGAAGSGRGSTSGSATGSGRCDPRADQAGTDQALTDRALTDQALTDQALTDQPFTGHLRSLDRMGTVQPGTVVVVFGGAGHAEVRQPGETVMPGWNPFRRGVSVLPVRTGIVTLTVRVADMTAFDNAAVAEVTVTVRVQLSEVDGFAVAGELAARHGAEVGTTLLEEVRTAVESGVRGAVRMNTTADLEEDRLTRILDDRWVPTSFVGGALLRRGMAVDEIVLGPGSGRPLPSAPARTPGRAPVTGRTTPGSLLDRSGVARPAATRSSRAPDAVRPELAEVRRGAAELELTVDARLRRIWRTICPLPVRGIAGASVGGSASVVAACDVAPEAYVTSRLAEAYGQLYEDRSLVLAVVGTTDVPTLVADWLRQVDHDHVRLVGVDALFDDEVLRIRVDGELASPYRAARGRPSATSSEVVALRALLPHRQVEITTVDTGPVDVTGAEIRGDVPR